MLEIVYAHETWDKHQSCIFLAGPSPRGIEHYNWRPQAIEILKRLEFNGAVFIPLPRDGNWLNDAEGQIAWELKYLNRASSIAFWIPRDKDNLPGFTTNVEFGMFLKSRKIVLGYPPEAVKMGYLHTVAEMESVPITTTLEETLREAIKMATF